MRYELRDVGVWDKTLGALLRFGDPGWTDYQAWLAAGNAADLPPYVPPVVHPAAVRKELRAQVNLLRDGYVFGGLNFGGNRYDTDAGSVTNLMQTLTVINAGVALPANFTWRTADDQDIPFDAAAVLALATAIGTHTHDVYKASWQIKKAIKNAADPTTIDITQGWPPDA